MARKKIDLRKVKPTKRYTVRELAGTLGITPRAIYWDIQVDSLPFYLVNGRKRIWPFSQGRARRSRISWLSQNKENRG